MSLPAESTTDPDDQASEGGFYAFLENRLFPKIIDYTIHPIHILALLVLWILLLVVHATVFELVGGNYTNGLSAMAASIVLLQQTKQQHELRRLHHEHRSVLQEIRRHVIPHSGDAGTTEAPSS